MAVAHNNSSSSGSGAATSVTWSHTCSGSDRLLIVGVSTASVAVSGVTFNGTALTRLDFGTESTGPIRGEFWYLIAPSATTANIVVTLASSAAVVVGASSYTGVNQTTPFGTHAKTTGDSSTASVTVSSASDQLVHDCLALRTGATGITAAAGQTSRWNRMAAGTAPSGTLPTGAGSTKAGAASVTATWTVDDATAKKWVHIAAPIMPSGTGYACTIAGTSRDVRNVFITEGVNARATLTCDVISSNASFRAALGDEIVITENGARIFGGIIDAPMEHGFGDVAAGSAIVNRISASGFGGYASRRVVNAEVVHSQLGITSTTVASPTTVTVASHGYTTGDTVEIVGSQTTPTLDGQHTVTVTGTNTFTVPVNVTTANPGGTVRKLATLKAVLETLEPYLTAYGVTLSGSQADGPAMPPLTWDYQRLDEILNELSTLSGWPWIISHSKVLSMSAPGSVAAPFNLAESGGVISQVVGDIRVTREQATDYYNKVWLISGGSGVVEKSEDFYWQNGVVVGSIRSWDTQYRVSSAITDKWPNVLIVNGVVTGVINWGPPDGSTFTWGWDYANNRLSFHTAGTALSSGDKISVTYAAQMPFTTQESDPAAIAARGLYEKVFEAPTATTIEAARSIGNALVERGVVEQTIVEYETWEDELILPGQSQTITSTKRNLSGSFLITDVTATQVGSLMKRRIRAISGSVLTAGWRDTYREWSGGRGSGATGVTVVLSNPNPAIIPGQEQVRYSSESAARAQIGLITSGTLQQARMQAITGHRAALLQNLRYTGTPAFNLDDTNKSGWLVQLVSTDDGDYASIERASAGANPRTLSQFLKVTAAGSVIAAHSGNFGCRNAAGSADVALLGITSANGLSLNANSQSVSITNPSTAATAGAIATYLNVTVGGTNYKLALYAV